MMLIHFIKENKVFDNYSDYKLIIISFFYSLDDCLLRYSFDNKLFNFYYKIYS